MWVNAILHVDFQKLIYDGWLFFGKLLYTGCFSKKVHNLKFILPNFEQYSAHFSDFSKQYNIDNAQI